MVRVKFLGTSASEWAAVLGRCSHDSYHLPGWMRAAEFGDGGKARAVYATNGEQELLVPIIRRRVDAEGWDAVSPYGYGGPIVSDDVSRKFIDAALRAIVDRLRETGCISWFIRLHPLLNAEWQSSVGQVVEQGKTVSIDLTKSEEAHWRETRRGHRKNIVRAMAEGVTVRIDRDFDDLSTLIRLYSDTMRRLEAAPSYYFDERYYHALVTEIGANLRLFVAEEAGGIIGATLFSVAWDTGIMQAHLFGMDEQYLHRHPYKVITHAARNWGREQGLKRLHLGGGVGGSSSDSLFNFKHGFSPDTHVFRTQRVIVDSKRYMSLCGGDDSVLSDMTGYFPAYRRDSVATRVGGVGEALAKTELCSR
ncbi:GNAT family N-acetyltransferase [Cupriavidus pinatubonensis]|nr:GNAT family N-acetyltransferase [Cupriavidus pinatubonensis]